MVGFLDEVARRWAPTPFPVRVLRRRRATAGDGEERLAGLLGLDLRGDDDGSTADAFVATVLAVVGSEGLRRALAHPENLPDPAELAAPGAWLARTVDAGAVPDDVSALLADADDGGDDARDRRDGGTAPDDPTAPTEPRA